MLTVFTVLLYNCLYGLSIGTVKTVIDTYMGKCYYGYEINSKDSSVSEGHVAKLFNMRMSQAERDLVTKLAELYTQELQQEVDSTLAARLALKEALEKRGVVIEEGLLGRKTEGRPKETALLLNLI